MSRISAMARGLAPMVTGRFIGGLTVDQALSVAGELIDQGLRFSLERVPPASAPSERTVEESAMASGEAASGEGAYRDTALPEASYALAAMERAGYGIAGGVLLSAEPLDALQPSFGQWPRSATRGVDALRVVAEQAQDAGIPLVLAESSNAAAPATMELALALQREGLDVGVTLSAALRRTESDCATFPGPVRLVSGQPQTGADRSTVSFRAGLEVDKSFVRCAKSRLRAGARLTVATNDVRMIDIIQALTARLRCPAGLVEYSFALGRAPRLQQRLLDSGAMVRVRIPYGPHWLARAVQGAIVEPGMRIVPSLVPAIRSVLPTR